MLVRASLYFVVVLAEPQLPKSFKYWASQYECAVWTVKKVSQSSYICKWNLREHGYIFKRGIITHDQILLCYKGYNFSVSVNIIIMCFLSLRTIYIWICIYSDVKKSEIELPRLSWKIIQLRGSLVISNWNIIYREVNYIQPAQLWVSYEILMKIPSILLFWLIVGENTYFCSKHYFLSFETGKCLPHYTPSIAQNIFISYVMKFCHLNCSSLATLRPSEYGFVLLYFVTVIWLLVMCFVTHLPIFSKGALLAWNEYCIKMLITNIYTCLMHNDENKIKCVMWQTTRHRFPEAQVVTWSHLGNCLK